MFTGSEPGRRKPLNADPLGGGRRSLNGQAYYERARWRASVLLSLWWLPFTLGVIGVGLSLYSYFAIESRGAHGSPLHYASAVVVGPPIFIYDDWQRVRKFDTSGRELASWRIKSGGGGATLSLNAAGQLEVFAHRTNVLYVYSEVGELISEQSMPSSPHDVAGQKLSADPSSGDTYALDHDALYLETGASVRAVVIPPGPPISSPAIGGAVSIHFFLFGAGLAAYKSKRAAT